MDKLWKILTGTQPQPISEAGTSNQQSIQNNYNGPVTVHAQNASLGCNDGNNKGQAENSSRKRSLPVDVDDLDCTRLKTYYKHTLCKTSPLPWYPEHAWNIHEVYTELALEDSVNNFGVEELFKQRDERFPEDASYRILIEGDAGYGKSTLMLKIAADWSKDSKDKTNHTSRFSLLLVVKLGYVGEDENLLRYMESIYKKKIMKMDIPLEDVLESEGAEKVLILLDGYDEANANTKKEVDRIMKKDMMMCCHVVLTSRFGHAPDAVKSKALRVTVKGFGRKQVMVAVIKFFIKAGHLTKADVISCLDELTSTLNKRSVWPWCHDSIVLNSDVISCLDELTSTLNKRSVWPWCHDSIVLNSDDFQNVQEIFPLLPEEKRLSLDQFKIFMKKVHDESPYSVLARCPLLCVMLCCLVSECPNSELPSTCSGLYFAMINRNLYRAARKKAEAAEEDEEQWNLDELDSQIHEGHESYLQEFGRLCVVGLKNKSMSFSLFDITGNKKVAKTTDVKVTQLIEAGVLVHDFTELNINKKISYYQVPHRTTAEFLAAYYLTRETDQNLLQQNLLDLFWLDDSFDEVAVSLIEMGKLRFLVDAFSVIKFPSDCLTDIPFIKSYFTQHGAAGTWSEFKDALPNKLQTRSMDHDHDIIVSSSEPCLTLQLIEEFGKMNTGNTNALRSLPKECLVSVQVKRARNLPILSRTLQSGVVLNSLEINFIESIKSNQMQYEVARRLQELLKAGSCPVQLSFTEASSDFLLAVSEAMQEVPKDCRLRSFEFVPKEVSLSEIRAMQEVPKDCRLRSFEFPDLDLLADTLPLLKVLAEKWLSHLQHLGMPSKYMNYTVESFKASSCELPWDRPYVGTLNRILKGLREPGCSLTSLHLNGFFTLTKIVTLTVEDLMMLATKLVTLRINGMDLDFDVTRISKWVVREKCSLKHLHLENVNLKLDGVLPSAHQYIYFLLALRNVARNLEELTIDKCVFPGELLSWLNLSVPNLRTLTIGRVLKWPPPNCDWDHGETKLLEALTLSSGESIEELSLLNGFWSSDDLMLHPIREALQRCPRMRKVELGISLSGELLKSIGPARSTSLSSSDEEALTSDNICLALLKIVLSVPMLQTLTFKSFFKYWKKIGTFGAIADEAKKRPGQRFDSECNALRLHGLSNENACHAMHVFRERKLEYRLRYVADEVYELWFPV